MYEASRPKLWVEVLTTPTETKVWPQLIKLHLEDCNGTIRSGKNRNLLGARLIKSSFNCKFSINLFWLSGLPVYKVVKTNLYWHVCVRLQTSAIRCCNRIDLFWEQLIVLCEMSGGMERHINSVYSIDNRTDIEIRF
jgi:hypothetical protein